MRNFTVPVANDYTDRIYLAAHDGQIVCLHGRSHPKPFWNKKYAEDQPLLTRDKRPEEKEIGQPKEAPKKEMEKKEAKE